MIALILGACGNSTVEETSLETTMDWQLFK